MNTLSFLVLKHYMNLFIKDKVFTKVILYINLVLTIDLLLNIYLNTMSFHNKLDSYLL